jgi:uncharacterized protein YyaL (SSP411 family)
VQAKAEPAVPAAAPQTQFENPAASEEAAAPATEPATDKPNEAPVAVAQASEDLATETPSAPPRRRTANRLGRETSPYLLMHAYNPVDWYAWGPEAFEKARAERKLIFLSIGYSSCYWCHVMERESFLDPEVAAFLNEHFVSIKVDREERPDIDEIYMAALQIYFQAIGSGQGGGWPLSMFLTPDGNPIMGGTYFPPRDREDGATGFLTVLQLVNDTWENDPQRIDSGSRQLTEYVAASLRQRPVVTAAQPGREWLDRVLGALADQFDPTYGGFGYSEANPRRPKFPEPSNLIFLADHAERWDDERARTMLLTTLDGLSRGGIRDHLGGGFHRYSTDRYWLVPHFEKMLYDQAQLAVAYAEAVRLFARPEDRQVLTELCDFVLRDMTSPEGGFYAAIDAETDHREGEYYVWSREEIESTLDPADYELFAAVYGLDGKPNFEEQYVLHRTASNADLQQRLGLSAGELESRLRPARERLLAVRSKRPRPLTDTKILTAWNGLMIRGLADAARVLDEPRYLAAAERAAEFVLDRLQAQDGGLLRSYREGQAKLNAYLDDYAFLVDGLVAIARASGDDRWLAPAEQLNRVMLEQFWDEEGGGLYFTSRDHEELIARSKNPVDSALPAGNAVAVGNLVALSRKLDRNDLQSRAESLILSFTPAMEDVPGSMPTMAVSLAALWDAQAARRGVRVLEPMQRMP